MRRDVSKTTVATERSVDARGSHGAPVTQPSLFDRKNDDVVFRSGRRIGVVMGRLDEPSGYPMPVVSQ